MNQDNSAKSIWDKRYQDGELACTQQTVELDPIDYTQHPFLYKQSTAKRITGSLEGNPLIEIAKQFLVPPAIKMLAVGSGLAFAEEALVRAGHVQHVVAFEASPVAVANAKERFVAGGLADRLDMRSGDVMSANLSDGEFDLVFVQAAIHHFYNIEEMFALFHRVLKPGGLLIYDEYIGPDHHLYEREVMDTLDEINECLAPQYRWDVMRQAVREEVPSATLDWMLQMDPSEGVHASMILPLTYKYFDVIHRVDYGGTVMRPFFVGILPNFDFSNAKDQTVARLIVKMEEMLVRNGILPSYHTKVVGKKLELPRNEFVETDFSRINYVDWPGFQNYGMLAKVPQIAEFVPADHSDGNWNCGVGIFGVATLFLAETRKAREMLRPGRSIRFRDMAVREIDSVQEDKGSLIVKFAGKVLDPYVAGYPYHFRIVDS
jgi:SAM-dependent methyltransferase